MQANIEPATNQIELYMCKLWVYYTEWEKREMFSHSLHFSVTPCSLYLQVFLSGKKKEKKKGSSHSDREKGRPGPGLSPLEHPDWSRPAVWALLPCGRRGRQFSERCCGRRAISAVLSEQIYSAGSKLIFFHCRDTFVAALKESSVQQLVLISVTGTKDLLTYECLLTEEMSECFLN